MASHQAEMPLYPNHNSLPTSGVALAKLLSSQVSKTCKDHIPLELVGYLHHPTHPYPRPHVHAHAILVPSCEANTQF